MAQTAYLSMSADTVRAKLASGRALWHGLDRVKSLERRITIAGLALALVGLLAMRVGMDISASDALDVVRTHPVAAPFVFVALYAGLVMLAVPSLPMNIGAGALWGIAGGTLLTVAGASAGALLGFAGARAFRGPIRTDADAAWQRIERATGLAGWRLVFFLRVNPVFPFSWVNYLLGLTPIPLTTYVWATAAGIVLPSLAFCAVGAQAEQVVLGATLKDSARAAALACSTLALVWLTARVLRRAGGVAETLATFRQLRGEP
jgi:uncharacterized membrane protein YdjX (TVP38/TMEM64 family)